MPPQRMLRGSFYLFLGCAMLKKKLFLLALIRKHKFQAVIFRISSIFQGHFFQGKVPETKNMSSTPSRGRGYASSRGRGRNGPSRSRPIAAGRLTRLRKRLPDVARSSRVTTGHDSASGVRPSRRERACISNETGPNGHRKSQQIVRGRSLLLP